MENKLYNFRKMHVISVRVFREILSFEKVEKFLSEKLQLFFWCYLVLIMITFWLNEVRKNREKILIIHF